MAERASHAAEPPAPLAAAMAAADVVLAPTVQSLSHTAARKAASEAGARIATLPGVTEEMLARVMSADMEGLRRKGQAVAAALDRGAEARITCANGSDLRLGLEGRAAIPDAGDLTRARRVRQPALRRGVHRARRGHGRGHAGRRRLDRRRRPVHASRSTLTIEAGHLRRRQRRRGRAAAGAADARTARTGTNVAELGIGTNEKATLTGDDPRGREDPRHRPRRLRRLGGDRRHRPGAGPPRLRGARARRRRSTASRSSAAASCSSERCPLLAVPNFSEGRDPERDRASSEAASPRGVAVLDRHSDPDHNRTVFTLAARPALWPTRSPRGAEAAIERIDMRATRALHPCIGALDVCPVVWLDRADRERRPRRGARDRRADRRPRRPGLPLRRAGQPPRAARARLLPRGRARRAVGADAGRRAARPTSGPAQPHPTAGATLVTARPPLAAFNVELDSGDARGRARDRRRAARVRRRAAGRAGDRPAALERPGPGLDQRPRPGRGPARRRGRASRARWPQPLGARPVEAELVGLVPEARAAPAIPTTSRSAASTPTST